MGTRISNFSFLVIVAMGMVAPDVFNSKTGKIQKLPAHPQRLKPIVSEGVFSDEPQPQNGAKFLVSAPVWEANLLRKGKADFRSDYLVFDKNATKYGVTDGEKTYQSVQGGFRDTGGNAFAFEIEEEVAA